MSTRVAHSRSGRIEGTVLYNKTGDDLDIRLQNVQDRSDLRRVVVGQNGTFRFERVPPGTYWLFVILEGVEVSVQHTTVTVLPDQSTSVTLDARSS
jgi:hypothetical protein